ncbi:putative zinc-binding metallopeptidase [Pinisolibacter sp. B13]|nr:putative zinc-binding metallopeptidase [Pinisolibacter aquiterrae]
MLLGHFRHEIGHCWRALSVGSIVARLRSARRLPRALRRRTGGLRRSVASSLRRRSAARLALRHVNAYASSRPWEDFAETWAHLMHRVDTSETARSFGLAPAPMMRIDSCLALDVDFDPHGTFDFARITEVWPALAVAVNAIARSLGQRDGYPFVTSPMIIEAEMAFAHGLIVEGGSS